MTATKTTKHGTIIVDDCDADLLLRCVVSKTTADCPYARIYYQESKRTVTPYLHRVILARVLNRELVRTEQVDHIDGNGLNNRRDNLRLATRTQNQGNRRAQQSITGLKGVTWNKHVGKYMAGIRMNKRRKHLGYFDDPQDAHAAYVAAARQYFGEFANDGTKE